MTTRDKKSGKTEKKPLVSWTPAPIPGKVPEGRITDPRLAAALAARERWHGRSGRPALKSPTQAVAFVRERRLVHVTAESAIPNLLDPIVGKACTEEERMESPARSTLDAWLGEVRASPDLLETRLCFERPTLVQADLWSCLTSIGRAREAEARKDRKLPLEAREALEIVDRRGTVPLERMAQMLDLDQDDTERLCGLLESQLLLVTRTHFDEDEEREVRVAESLLQWLERTPHPQREMEPQRAWTLLFIAALRAAVVLWPEEIHSLFPWSPSERLRAIEEAMGTGTVISYSEGSDQVLVASPVPR